MAHELRYWRAELEPMPQLRLPSASRDCKRALKDWSKKPALLGLAGSARSAISWATATGNLPLVMSARAKISPRQEIV
jgi:hypothetical protein